LNLFSFEGRKIPLVPVTTRVPERTIQERASGAVEASLRN